MRLHFLDHIALRVVDIQQSAQWYHRVLGMKVVQPPEWEPFPIFLLAGESESGIALFPARKGEDRKIDHFAFRIGPDDYAACKERLTSLDIGWREMDHTYFRSVYFHDPDGHEVELTCKIRDMPGE